MPLKQILQGGESRARNRTILNMFSFVNIGERAGSGYPLILKATKDGNYPSPNIFENFNPDVTKLTIFIKKSVIKKENLGNEEENLGNEEENLGNEVNISSLINELKIKSDVKNNLNALYNIFKNTFFGNIDLQIQLNINKNTATSYIRILKENNLIESVPGHGKGKYKFK